MNNPGSYLWIAPDIEWWEAICKNNPRCFWRDYEIDKNNPDGITDARPWWR